MKHKIPGRALLWILPVFAIGLFFLPSDDWKWSFGYTLFLASLVGLPVLLPTKHAPLVRGVVIVLALAYFGFLQSACPRPTGAIELVALHLFDDKPILKHVIKVAILSVTAIFFARYFCGWLCPKGTIQELLFRRKYQIRVPPKVDRILKLGKYVVLVALVVAPMVWHYRLLREIGPFKVIFNLDGETGLLTFLGIVLLASIFIERPFCRYFCPAGGLLALFTKISLFRVRVRQDECNNCGACAKVCPTDAIEVNKGVSTRINSECIVCHECQRVCPKSGIYYGIPSRKVSERPERLEPVPSGEER